MIAALAALLAAGEEPRILKIRVEGNGDTAPCVAHIDGKPVDPTDEASLTAGLARYAPKLWRIELSADEMVTYRCIGSVIYRIQAAQYEFTKMGFVQTPSMAK